MNKEGNINFIRFYSCLVEFYKFSVTVEEMCLAVPLKIVNLDGNTAQAEIEGVKRTIRVDFVKDLKVGDYVIVHAGFAIEKLNEEDALENLRLIKEVADAIK